jgi:predicted secreted hydrolase
MPERRGHLLTWRFIWISCLLILVTALLIFLVGKKRTETTPSPLTVQAATPDISGFARATGPRAFVFPADHGPHPDYQTEWWYYTGNLQTVDGRRFGYQLTFFRRALAPPAQLPRRTSDWATDQVYMAHFALSDINGIKHHAFERLGRGAAGLAGAQVLDTSPAPFKVWLDDWQVEGMNDNPSNCPQPDVQPCVYHLAAEQEGFAVDLTLSDLKGPILQGDQGYSQKGPQPGQASYYYSLTRLVTQGFVQIGDERFAVQGLSWMDHEWSTSALSSDQVGWDWFSIQLDDGGELMVFQIRDVDGSIDPFSSGALIAADGSVSPLRVGDFIIEPLSTWKSPRSGGVYPSHWRIHVPAAGLELEVKPLLADQELNVSYAYWEGAVSLVGTRQGASVTGNGYVELTGYSGSMGGKF